MPPSPPPMRLDMERIKSENSRYMMAMGSTHERMKERMGLTCSMICPSTFAPLASSSSTSAFSSRLGMRPV